MYLKFGARSLHVERPYRMSSFVQVLDPRTALLAPTQVEAMARSINTSREVQVRDLQIVTRYGQGKMFSESWHSNILISLRRKNHSEKCNYNQNLVSFNKIYN